MCSDSYPIPILSLFFLYHPYIPYFLIQKCFHFLVDTSSEEGNEKIGNCVHYCNDARNLPRWDVF